MVGSFMLVCPPKALTFEGPGVVRSNTDKQVVETLQEYGMDSCEVNLAVGGGVAIEKAADKPQFFSTDSCLVVFTGELSNFEHLAGKVDMFKDKENKTVQKTANAEAELLSKMYELYSVKGILGKIRGTFSFVVLDTKTVRLFAARDPSGKIPLLQCHKEDGSHVVANFEFKASKDSENITEVKAGCFIAGGRRSAVPEMFSPPLADLEVAAAKARNAVASALANIGSVQPVPPKPQPKRRRRKAKNDKAESAKVPTTNLNVNAPSFMPTAKLEGQPVVSPAAVSASKGRANRSTWWRHEKEATATRTSRLAIVDATKKDSSSSSEAEEEVEERAEVVKTVDQAPATQEARSQHHPQQVLIEEAVEKLHRIASTKSLSEWAQEAEDSESQSAVANVKLQSIGKPLSRTGSFKEIAGGMVRVPSCRDVMDFSSQLQRTASHSELSAL